MNSVTLTNFRGIGSVTVPLARATMITGTNGVGKTSILEGLYCLFSETRLDVSPLARYGRSIGITNPYTGSSVGTVAHGGFAYNHPRFWEECPKYGSTSCGVSARLNDMLWEWTYRKANNYSEIPPELMTAANQPGWNYHVQTEYAIWDWKIGDDADAHQSKAMGLSIYAGHMPPAESKARSFCKYIDFATTCARPSRLTFQVSKMLAEALRLINPHVTDVRFEGVDSGLSVILNDERSVSLDTLGNGATTLVNALIVILEALETQVRTMPDAPFFVLIDEIGAAMYYGVMLDVWKYLRMLSEKYPNMYFITTSHSSDCIRAFCEVFGDRMDNNEARLVRLDKDGENIYVVQENGRCIKTKSI